MVMRIVGIMLWRGSRPNTVLLSSLLHVEKLARNKNDLDGFANRRRLLGFDGVVFQAAIPVVDSLFVRSS
jgi:hypothetical protein